MGSISTELPENTEAFTENLHASWGELMVSLGQQQFYLEMLMVAVAVMAGYLASYILRRHTLRHLEKHPPNRFDKDLILKPLVLLTPLMIFFMLGFAKPLAQEYANGSQWVSAIMKLTLAYVAARGVMVYVKARSVAYFIAVVVMLIAVLDVSGFLEATRATLGSIAFTFGKFRLSILGLAQGIIILVIVFWVANGLSTTFEGHLRRSSRLNYNTRELLVKFFKIFVYCIAFLVTLSAMGIDLTALAIFGGALGVGIGLGLQRITANFISGIILLVERSIKIGDLIEVTGVTGWVRSLNVRYALIETRDGRELLIPNEMLVSTQVTNWTYTSDNARVEFTVGVAYNSDVELVTRLVLEAIEGCNRYISTPAPSCQLSQFGDSALIFSITFWISNVGEGRRQPQSEVMTTILHKFREHGVEIPYPQQVVYVRQPIQQE